MTADDPRDALAHEHHWGVNVHGIICGRWDEARQAYCDTSVPHARVSELVAQAAEQHAPEPLVERLRAVCDKYGLPLDPEGLERHLVNNAALRQAFDDLAAAPPAAPTSEQDRLATIGARTPEWFQQQWNGVAECVICGGRRPGGDPDDPREGHRPRCPFAALDEPVTGGPLPATFTLPPITRPDPTPHRFRPRLRDHIGSPCAECGGTPFDRGHVWPDEPVTGEPER